MQTIVTSAAAAELIEAAGAAEQRFAARLDEEERADAGTSERWGAAATLAHLTEWKALQVERLHAYFDGNPAPACDGLPFPHRDPAAYAPLAAVPWDGRPEEAMQVTSALAALTRRLADCDLKNTFPWTLEKPLAQQLLGRGAWHTVTHLTEYEREHGREGEARLLSAELGRVIARLGAWPVPGDPMGHYNVACLCAAAGDLGRAETLLREAVAIDPALADTARFDPDLAAVAA